MKFLGKQELIPGAHEQPEGVGNLAQEEGTGGAPCTCEDQGPQGPWHLICEAHHLYTLPEGDSSLGDVGLSYALLR